MTYKSTVAPITIRRTMSKGRNKRELLPGQTREPIWEEQKGSWNKVSGHCVVTKEPHEIQVLGTELDEWLDSDKLIQHCLSCDSEDREFLMTGISPAGWDIMFPPIVGEEDE